MAAAATKVAAAPAMAPRFPISLLIDTSQVIEPKRLYHANLVNAKLRRRMPAILICRTGCGEQGVMLTGKAIPGTRRRVLGPAGAIDRGSTRLTLE